MSKLSPPQHRQQAPRQPEAFQDRGRGDGIGGTQHSAQNEGRAPEKSKHEMRNEHHRHGGGKDQPDRQKRDGSPVIAKIAPGRVEGIPIEQRWKKDEKHDVWVKPDFR